MKIVADSKIPFLSGVFEKLGINVLYKTQISREDVIDADALIVRTRTRCDRSLLEGTSVRFVATATIGFDHIDLGYLSENKIGFSSSAGCNARGVAQWVLAALREMNIPKSSVIGIVGVGNVGSQLSEMAEKRGWKVLRNDPPRAKKEGNLEFVELDTLLKCSDVLTMHVPLNESTNGLVSAELLEKFRGSCFLNSSRPAVVDEDALLSSINNGKLSKVAIDVWKNEPKINKNLLDKVTIATPHIAGYSKRGKVRATEMAVRALSNWFNLDYELKNWKCPESYKMEEPEYYDIMVDDENLRKNPSAFEDLRNNYRYR